MRISSVLLLVLSFAFANATHVFATDIRSDADTTVLSADVLWEMQRVGAPIIAPDGRWVVAPVTRYEVEGDESHTDLWLFAVDGSLERPLTRHGSADGQAVFSPDGSTLAFVSRREDDDAAQIYLLPIDTPGEARRLTEIPTGVSAPRWVGEHIYFVSNVWPEMTWEEMAAELKRRESDHVSAHRWTALPTSSWDRWVDEDRQAHLYRISPSSRQVDPVTLHTEWELPRSSQGLSSYDVAPDESLVAFLADSRRDGVDPDIDLFLLRPGDTEASNITPDNEASDGSPLFSPDGSTLAFVTQGIKGFYGDTRRLTLYDVREGNHREVTTDWDRSADGLIWHPDGSALYGAIDDAGTRRIYEIPIDGRAPRTVTGDTDFSSIDVAEDGTIVAINQSFLYPPRVGLVDPATGAFFRLDTVNDDVLADVELGTYESVTYQGANGQDIQM
ncbi:MAG: S9 family peptidase, partial [Bacteroidota bacterium]